MTVRCWIDGFTETGCRVAFEIDKIPTAKRICDGYCDYVLVVLATGRATPIPAEVKAKYSI
jgi:acyl-CoA thioesterase FadM